VSNTSLALLAKLTTSACRTFESAFGSPDLEDSHSVMPVQFWELGCFHSSKALPK